MRREALDLALRFDCVPVPQPSAPPACYYPAARVSPRPLRVRRRPPVTVSGWSGAAGHSDPDRRRRGAAARQPRNWRRPSTAASRLGRRAAEPAWPGAGPDRRGCPAGSCSAPRAAAPGSARASSSRSCCCWWPSDSSSGRSGCRAGADGTRTRPWIWTPVFRPPTTGACRSARRARRLAGCGTRSVPSRGPRARGTDHPRGPAGPNRLGGRARGKPAVPAVRDDLGPPRRISMP